VIRFLRFAGVMIAAVWLGALVFHTCVTGPALSSAVATERVFGPNAAYGAPATGLILSSWYYSLGTVCAVLALVHLFLENLYLGRGVNRRWLTLVLILLGLNVCGSFWLNPRMVALHQSRFQRNSTPEARVAAAKSFATWNGCFQAMHVVLLAGVAAVLWRATNPNESSRYVRPAKFRG
jgi:hypothetical protein